MNTNKSNILSFAPHGGGIEAGSSELALLISQSWIVTTLFKR